MTPEINNIIITSGGTITPIDKMRVLTNKAAGNTWAKMAEDMIQEGHQVTYVATGKTVLPYTHKMQLSPASVSPESAASQIRELQNKMAEGILRIIQAPFFSDYQREMVRLARNSVPGDVAIIAAAVSDYGMKQVVDGKISSQHQELMLELERLPKIINLMRQVSPSLVMIGFKLLPTESTLEATRQKLVEASVKQMQWASQTDLVIANASAAVVGESRMKIVQTLVVEPDGRYMQIDRRDISTIILEKLPALIEKRVQKA